MKNWRWNATFFSRKGRVAFFNTTKLNSEEQSSVCCELFLYVNHFKMKKKKILINFYLVNMQASFSNEVSSSFVNITLILFMGLK